MCWKEEYMRLFVLYGDIQHNTDNKQNVASYWNGEDEVKNFSQICDFLLNMQGNTENRRNVALKFGKRRNFLLSCKPKCASPCGKRKMSLLRNYLRTNQISINKNDDDHSEVEEIEHDSSGKLFAYS